MMRDLAPSNELRKWFHAHMEQWPMFRKKYLQELREPGAAEALAKLSGLLAERHQVTLLFASKNSDQNNAVVLKEVMEGGKKPPHTTKLAAQRARKSRRRG